jgi:hypothetical protein
LNRTDTMQHLESSGFSTRLVHGRPAWRVSQNPSQEMPRILRQGHGNVRCHVHVPGLFSLFMRMPPPFVLIHLILHCPKNRCDTVTRFSGYAPDAVMQPLLVCFDGAPHGSALAWACREEASTSGDMASIEVRRPYLKSLVIPRRRVQVD